MIACRSGTDLDRCLIVLVTTDLDRKIINHTGYLTAGGYWVARADKWIWWRPSHSPSVAWSENYSRWIYAGVRLWEEIQIGTKPISNSAVWTLEQSITGYPSLSAPVLGTVRFWLWVWWEKIYLYAIPYQY